MLISNNDYAETYHTLLFLNVPIRLSVAIKIFIKLTIIG